MTPIIMSSDKDLIINIQIPQTVVQKYSQECRTLNDTIVFHLENFNKRLVFLEEISKLERRSLDEVGKEVRLNEEKIKF